MKTRKIKISYIAMLQFGATLAA